MARGGGVGRAPLLLHPHSLMTHPLNGARDTHPPTTPRADRAGASAPKLPAARAKLFDARSLILARFGENLRQRNFALQTPRG